LFVTSTSDDAGDVGGDADLVGFDISSSVDITLPPVTYQ
jgi:hypothetical protein